jgi:hypothetical protein
MIRERNNSSITNNLEISEKDLREELRNFKKDIDSMSKELEISK